MSRHPRLAGAVERMRAAGTRTLEQSATRL